MYIRTCADSLSEYFAGDPIHWPVPPPAVHTRAPPQDMKEGKESESPLLKRRLEEEEAERKRVEATRRLGRGPTPNMQRLIVKQKVLEELEERRRACPRRPASRFAARSLPVPCAPRTPPTRLCRKRRGLNGLFPRSVSRFQEVEAVNCRPRLGSVCLV
jgi:hypothetical protein